MRVGASDAHGRRSRWVSIVSGACVLGWAVPALLMLDKGFAVQDEGTYVLSYRFWSSNPYFVSGAQYVYGPVFEAVGESIPWLRLLRLVMLVGVNAWFAGCFLTWLEQRRPGLLPSSRKSLILLITASGGMSYLWTPLTPGYYDLTADCCLALVGLLFLTLVRSPQPPAWIPWTTGVVGVALVVTKWTAFPALALTVCVGLWCLGRTSRRAVAGYAAHLVLAAGIALMACHLFLIPLGRFVSIMGKVSSLTTVASHSFVYLATDNLASTATLTLAAAVIGLPLGLGLFAARAAARHDDDTRARRWLLGAAVTTTLILPFVVGWHGGDEHGRAIVGAALAGLLAAALAAVLNGPGQMPGGSEGRLVAVVLLLVPFLQAAGTNVPLLYVAAECLAMWVALVLMLVTRSEVSQVTASAVLIDLMVLVVATAMVAGTTTLMTPFKTTSIRADTQRVPELGMRVAPTTARQYAALQAAVAPYVIRGSTPMITLDQMAGLTYLLGGVPAGSTWTDAASPSRTAGILELACRNGDVPTTRRPVLLVDRPIDRLMVRAMRTCGFGDPGNYRELDVPLGPPGIRVLVPRSES